MKAVNLQAEQQFVKSFILAQELLTFQAHGVNLCGPVAYVTLASRVNISEDGEVEFAFREVCI